MRHGPKATILRWVSTGILVALGAAAPSMHQGPYGHGQGPDQGSMERTLSFGLSAIIGRHLEPVTAQQLAFEGLKGLGSIDPEITVTREDRRILLTAADHVVAEYPAPGTNDLRNWTRVMIAATQDARALSKSLSDADAERILEAMFDAALGKLDVFSRYSGAREAREHRAARNGFGGIGIRFEMKDAHPQVTEVIPETPAALAGLEVGDIITHVEGRSLNGLEREEISRRMRGAVDSDLSLTVRRGYKPIDITLRRALIVPPTVQSQLRDHVLLSRITGFNQRTAQSLRHDLESAQAKAGVKGVILDLRGNPGGLLDQAVTLSDLFIKDGPVLFTKGRHPMSSQSYDAHPGDPGEDLPVVVLVDGKSASASEIVASALMDRGRAVVVGSTTYGKGTVQTVIALPNDGEITLTWSRFHAPTGYALQGLGVPPTLCTQGGGDPLEQLEGPRAFALASHIAKWRRAPLKDVDERTRLRAACPAQPAAQAEGDVELARHLLSDPHLFAQALAISTPDQANAAEIPGGRPLGQ